MAGDDETLCNVARFFTREYQFITDSYRLFSALNRLSDRPNKWYNSGASQKYILRQIKAMDFALNGEKRKMRLNEQKASYTTRDEAGNSILPKEMDVALLMLYGHMLYYGSSYSYSLSEHCHSLTNNCVLRFFPSPMLIECQIISTVHTPWNRRTP